MSSVKSGDAVKIRRQISSLFLHTLMCIISIFHFFMCIVSICHMFLRCGLSDFAQKAVEVKKKIKEQNTNKLIWKA